MLARRNVLWLAIAQALMLLAVCSVGPVPAQYGSGLEVAVPAFYYKNGMLFFGAKCCVVRWGGRAVLLAPLHTFCQVDTSGRIISCAKQSEINDRIDHAELVDFSYRQKVDDLGKSLLKQDIPYGSRSASMPGDMVAFDISANSHMRMFNLSATIAPVGTPVWVLSHDLRSAATGIDRYAGVVSQSSPISLAVKLTQDAPEGSSGSPIIDSRNELVGMLVEVAVGNRKLVFAIPCTAMTSRLSQEIGR